MASSEVAAFKSVWHGKLWLVLLVTSRIFLSPDHLLTEASLLISSSAVADWGVINAWPQDSLFHCGFIMEFHMCYFFLSETVLYSCIMLSYLDCDVVTFVSSQPCQFNLPNVSKEHKLRTHIPTWWADQSKNIGNIFVQAQHALKSDPTTAQAFHG